MTHHLKNKPHDRTLWKYFLWGAIFAGGISFGSCVDELVPSGEPELDMSVTTVLTTNLITEINAQVTGELASYIDVAEEVEVENNLAGIMKEYFAATIQDITLYVYDLEGNYVEENVKTNIQDTATSFSIPFGDCNLVAVSYANQTYGTEIINKEHNTTLSVINSSDADTITGHSRGIYSNKFLLIDPYDGMVINIPIFMNNGVFILNVINNSSKKFKVLKMYADSTAGKYLINDSIYFFDNSPVVSYNIEQTSEHVTSCYALHYPTKRCSTTLNDSTDTRAAQEEAVQYPLVFNILVHNEDSTFTMTNVKMAQEVAPGHITVVNATLTDEGGVIPIKTTNCAVMISADWKPGSSFEVDI